MNNWTRKPKLPSQSSIWSSSKTNTRSMTRDQNCISSPKLRKSILGPICILLTFSIFFNKSLLSITLFLTTMSLTPSMLWSYSILYPAFGHVSCRLWMAATFRNLSWKGYYDAYRCLRSWFWAWGPNQCLL